MQPIITSLLDTDLYKLTMMQTVYHQFPNAQEVEYHFKCRTKDVNLTQHIDTINFMIDEYCKLSFTEEELQYLSTLRYIKKDFLNFLSLFKPQRKYIEVVKLNSQEIDVVIKGPWLYTILFEVPILAIINQTYFENTLCKSTYTTGEAKLKEKISELKALNNDNFKFSDFGTRRRYSFEWHEYVIRTLKNELPNNFTGTSNVYFAKKYNLTPIGTMAHEYLQACQALGPRLRDSQKFALEKWVQEYRGDLGIALTDVVGIDSFLKDFDLYFCKLFDGVRHDSGDPYEWTDKILFHYEKMKINPLTKNLVYSDGLTFTSAINLFNTFHKRANLFFGIGTNLTNDLGFKPLNIVLKMTECNGSPVAKLSDSPGKTMCRSESYMTYLKEVFSQE